MSALTIYKASAGAGKTFRLVVEYIKLLIVNPENYRHILAVTFTKKATKEMKIRILTQLYGLWKTLPSSESYMKTIRTELYTDSGNHEDITTQISRNAGKALQMILDDYNRFRIETIDSFFQSVLRNMTKELDINFNMRVELNGERVKDKAIDQMIDYLEPTDTDFRRIVEFAEENMREGKSWNIIGDLKKFGKNIFTDFYQSHAAEYKQRLTDNPNLFRDNKTRIRDLQRSWEEAIVLLGKKIKDSVEQSGLEIGMFKNSNKSGLEKYLNYIENDQLCKIPATIYKYLESENEWLKKADMKPANVAVVSEQLMPMLQNVVDIHEKSIRMIQSCRLWLKHLNNIELLSSIENAVNRDNEAANRFMLSSTNQLLADMIGDSDASFIFEKTGTQIHHLMIDEFQDTSTVQWSNFKKLLRECMSNFNKKEAQGTIGSMIVGDVKQSIYRWRGGDWNLLNQINQEFENEEQIEIRNLQTNFRSDQNVIEFNNAFFEKAREVYGINGAYDDVSQQVPKGKDALGGIEFYMLTEQAYKTRIPLVCEKVKQMIDSGIKPNKIAILSRESKTLKAIAKLFSETYPEINVVSKESFQLNSSEAVNIIICALKLLNKPHDKILIATLNQKLRKRNESIDVSELVKKIANKSSFLETIETIYRELMLDTITDDGAFVSTFFDFVKDFSANNTATLRNFLKHWEETLQEKTIESEAPDGVQLMTIHKSKGLEFENVLIADGNWNTDVSKNNIWVETSVPPFNEIPFNIFRASKELKGSIYEKEYLDECYQNIVDNLNLLYVAFTRAEKRLVFFGQKSKDENSLVEQCLDSMDGGRREDLGDDVGEKICFGRNLLSGNPETASLDSCDTNNYKETKNVFEMPVTAVLVPIKANRMGGKFRQSNRSKDFVNQESASPYIETGLIMHNILSQIETLEDVEKVLKRMETEGIINDKNLKSLIEKRLYGNEVRKWFSPEWTVYNECSILTKDGEKRPDRVICNGEKTIVIDFKFGNEKLEHKEQIREYKRLLQEIGFPDVEGVLWYVYKNKSVIL